MKHKLPTINNLKILSVGLILLISFSSCNKGVIDFEDNIHPILQENSIKNDTIYVANYKPSKIRYYTSYARDTLYYEEYGFNYIGNRLERIISQGSNIVNFIYDLDTVKYSMGDNNYCKGIIKNNKIESANDFVHCIYNSENYLIQIFANEYDSVFYTYKNGNVVEKVLSPSLYEITEYGTGKAIVSYEYYDTLIANSNEYIFSFNENSLGLFSNRFYYLRYLDIFGRPNKNLIKSKKVYDPRTKHSINYLYFWNIENSLVRTLYIKDKDLNLTIDKISFYYD